MKGESDYRMNVITKRYMNKKLKKLVIVLLTIIFVSIYSYSFADVGSFDRYDSGSDWGGSSSWSSSDWGSSSSSWDWDDDYSSSSSSGSGDLGFLLGLLLGSHGGRISLFIIIAIIYFIYKKGGFNGGNISYRPQRPNTGYQTPGNQTASNPNVTAERSAGVANRIREVDPLFAPEKFLTFTKELFVKLQNAWTARDWEPMRLFETPELFEQHSKQIQGYIDTNRINVMDRIAVEYAYLYSYRTEGEKEILEVALKSVMKDYIIDAKTKDVLEGNPNIDRHTLYKLTFERKKGTVTEKEDEIKTTNCPNCGAPTKITSAGKCEYCGSVIMIGDHGWVLSNLEPFRD